MKSTVIELQEKANQLLQMAQDMDKRVELIKGWIQDDLPQWYKERKENELDCCQRGSKRLWSSYLQVLTQIKLEL
jgi:phosphoserine phosphatase